MVVKYKVSLDFRLALVTKHEYIGVDVLIRASVTILGESIFEETVE